MNKVILFGGPSRSGKDTSAQFIIDAYGKHKVKHYKFAEPLKNAVHALYGLNVPMDHFERTKDYPNEIMNGLTPRKEYMKFSENIIKPTYGKDFWGRIAARKIAEYLQDYMTVVSDFGFREELVPLSATIGSENIVVVNLYRDGCDYSNDSRNYVNCDGLVSKVINITANNKQELFLCLQSELNIDIVNPLPLFTI
jgi:hypothetical protein